MLSVGNTRPIQFCTGPPKNTVSAKATALCLAFFLIQTPKKKNQNLSRCGEGLEQSKCLWKCPWKTSIYKSFVPSSVQLMNRWLHRTFLMKESAKKNKKIKNNIHMLPLMGSSSKSQNNEERGRLLRWEQQQQQKLCKLQTLFLPFSQDAPKKFQCKLVQIILEPKAQLPAQRLPMRQHLGSRRPAFICFSHG